VKKSKGCPVCRQRNYASASTCWECDHAFDEGLQATSGDLKIGRRGIKPPLHEVPLWALQGVSRVLDYGGRKYAPGNWIKAAKEGDPKRALEDYMSAALRHWAAMDGWGALDDESGLPHIDHMLCSLIMLRGIAIRAKIMEADPGVGNDPE